jgi:hypothetical protein
VLDDRATKAATNTRCIARASLADTRPAAHSSATITAGGASRTISAKTRISPGVAPWRTSAAGSSSKGSKYGRAMTSALRPSR